MYKTIHDVTIGDLQKNATHIHYFGLGFIQVKLGPVYRMHFYTDILPPIIDKEDVHNHRYDFTSHIFYGTFTQELFSPVKGSAYILEEESCKEGYTPDASKSIICNLEKISEEEFSVGSSYFISHKTLHRVSAKNAITFLKRSSYKKELAHVARKQNTPKICPFSKKIDDKELWDIVEKMLTEAKFIEAKKEIK